MSRHRYHLANGGDEFWATATTFDMGQVRWLYRYARKNGLSRDDARFVIHMAFHIGIRSQMNRARLVRRAS